MWINKNENLYYANHELIVSFDWFSQYRASARRRRITFKKKKNNVSIDNIVAPRSRSQRSKSKQIVLMFIFIFRAFFLLELLTSNVANT